MIELTINGRREQVDVESDTPLLWVLRDTLGLTGTRFGCGMAQCGACTVHLNGQAVRSCLLPVSAVAGADILTIEGLGREHLHPLQEAWIELSVPQCGYCQSGQIMAAAALLKNKPTATGEEIRSGMTNLCRCATYQRIQAAIELARDRMLEQSASAGSTPLEAKP